MPPRLISTTAASRLSEPTRISQIRATVVGTALRGCARLSSLALNGNRARRSGERLADDLRHVLRQAAGVADPLQGGLRARASLFVEFLPAIESPRHPCRHLRVELVQRQDLVGKKAVARAVR